MAMVGKQFGQLLVLEKAFVKHSHTYYTCKCLKCGENTVVSGANMRSGNTTKCKDCRLKKFSKEKELEIIKESEVSTISEVSKKYGISKSSLSRMRKRHGFPPKKRGRPLAYRSKKDRDRE